MNKPGDIVQTFGNPVTSQTPLGQVRLIKKLSYEGDIGLENWQVEYLDDEGYIYNFMIKNPDYKPEKY